MRGKFKRKELGTLLRQCEPPRMMMEDRQFWPSFRLRAALVRQEKTNRAKTEKVGRPWLANWRFSTVAAGLLLLFSLYLVIDNYFSPSSPSPTLISDHDSPITPGGEAGNLLSSRTLLLAARRPEDKNLSTVEHVDISIDYDGLMIFNDEDHGGTFILLAQLNG